MKSVLFSQLRRLHCSIRSNSLFPIVPGNWEDNYLPTNFVKKNKIVTVFGGTGFLGDNLIHELAKNGCQIIIPYRGDVYEVRHIRMIGAVGQNLFMPFSVEDDKSIIKAIKDSNIVINLIGCDFQNHHFSFKELNVDIAAKIARLSKQNGVQSLVHVSALGACENPKPHLLSHGSEFLKTKWLGEQEVAREFPGVTIFRPANIWGVRDRFIFHFLNSERLIKWRKVNIPLWRLGQETVKQPVYVRDVARGIAKVVLDEKYSGWTIEAVGPQRFQLDHLVTWFYLNKKHKLEDIIISELSHLFLLKARWKYRVSPLIPIFTEDSLERECVTDTLTGCPTLENLGIKPIKIEDRLQWILKPYKCIGYSWDDAGAFDPPPTPPVALTVL